MLILDRSGRVVDCNPAAQDMFAAPRESIIGFRPSEVGESIAAAVPDHLLHEALDSRCPWAGDVPIPGDPDERVSSLQIFPLRNDDHGVPAGVVCISRDVTHDRRTAARLAHAEQLWRSVLDVAPTGLAVVGLDGHFVRVNTALCRIVGYTAEQLRQLTFQEITYADDLAGDLTLVNRLLAGEIDYYTLEKRYLHAHGHTVWVQLSVALIHDPGTHRPDQFVVAIENITQRRLAAERLSAIIAGASDPFVGITATGEVTEWNAAAEKLFGWTRPEALGRSLDTLIVPPDQRRAHREGLTRLRLGSAGRILNQPVELDALTKTHQLVPVELTVWQADGEGGEFYAFVRDTTARTRERRSQAAIAAAQFAIAAVELSPQKVMQEICVHAQALTTAQAACVEVVEGQEIVHRAVTGSAEPHHGLRVPLRFGLSGLAIATGQTLICHDSDTDPRVDPLACRQAGERSMVVVPLRRGDDIHGVIKVFSAQTYQFDDTDASTLTLLAAPFGAALANAWQLEATAQEAVTDALTGLGNRAHGLRELDRALLRQERRGSGNIAVMFIDLDLFKQVNDTFGHHAGDTVLIAVAHKLRLALRNTDTCARYGGDEFLVLCEGLAASTDVSVLADRLITLIAGNYPLTSSEGSPHAEIGASIGIAVTSTRLTATDLLQAADQAMYDAKSRGGNTYSIRPL